MAFSVTMVLLALVASLYFVLVQRHALLRKRSERARILYLTEAGMNDAIARLRIGNLPGINPAIGRRYCLNVLTSIATTFVTPCLTTSCPVGQVRVCVSDNSSGTNKIDVAANF